MSYPQSTFEALFVEPVNGRDYLKELVDALFIIEVSKLLKGLLDLLTKSLRLVKMRGKRERKYFQGSSLSGRKLVQAQKTHKRQLTRHTASNNRRFNLISDN